MLKKYKLTFKTINVGGSVLHRIVALRDFGDVRSGDLGGYIRCENNLDHRGNCWVSDNACIYQDARVYEDAKVSGDARVFWRAQVSGDAWVSGNVRIWDNARVSQTARVFDTVYVYGQAHISGTACVIQNVTVFNKVNLDRGIWNRIIHIDDKRYLVSTTLKRVLV